MQLLQDGEEIPPVLSFMVFREILKICVVDVDERYHEPDEQQRADDCNDDAQR